MSLTPPDFEEMGLTPSYFEDFTSWVRNAPVTTTRYSPTRRVDGVAHIGSPAVPAPASGSTAPGPVAEGTVTETTATPVQLTAACGFLAHLPGSIVCRSTDTSQPLCSLHLPRPPAGFIARISDSLAPAPTGSQDLLTPNELQSAAGAAQSPFVGPHATCSQLRVFSSAQDTFNNTTRGLGKQLSADAAAHLQEPTSFQASAGTPLLAPVTLRPRATSLRAISTRVTPGPRSRTAVPPGGDALRPLIAALGQDSDSSGDVPSVCVQLCNAAGVTAGGGPEPSFGPFESSSSDATLLLEVAPRVAAVLPRRDLVRREVMAWAAERVVGNAAGSGADEGEGNAGGGPEPLFSLLEPPADATVLLEVGPRTAAVLPREDMVRKSGMAWAAGGVMGNGAGSDGGSGAAEDEGNTNAGAEGDGDAQDGGSGCRMCGWLKRLFKALTSGTGGCFRGNRERYQVSFVERMESFLPSSEDATLTAANPLASGRQR